jgi:hypothetical protein
MAALKKNIQGGICMSQFTYEIQENLGVISESENGWKKEFKIISWNNNLPKYDIRDWSPDGKKMGKGTTFTQEEILKLKELVAEINI